MTHLNEKIDIKLRLDDDGIYDIHIDDDGDLESTGGIETSLILSFFGERRADSSEVAIPFLRRGWWGNDETDPQNFEIGSKLWLIYDDKATPLTVSKAEDFTRQALQWLITDKIFRKLEVEAELINDTINIKVTLVNQGNNIETVHFDLLNQTIRELENAT